MDNVIKYKTYSQFTSLVRNEIIYTFGGYVGDSIQCESRPNCIFDEKLNDVFYFDRQSHTWQKYYDR